MGLLYLLEQGTSRYQSIKINSNLNNISYRMLQRWVATCFTKIFVILLNCVYWIWCGYPYFPEPPYNIYCKKLEFFLEIFIAEIVLCLFSYLIARQFISLVRLMNAINCPFIFNVVLNGDRKLFSISQDWLLFSDFWAEKMLQTNILL